VSALRERLGRGCHLCVPSYLSALCLVHDAGDVGSGCRPHLRELVPCHCTAAGKALLAWRESWREAVLAEPLESFTDRTTTGPESLRRELGRTVARGYAVEDREYEPDTRGLAAPVFGETGEAVAALAVIAPMADMPADRYSEFGDVLMGAAAELSNELGHSAAEPPEASAAGARAA